MARFGVSGQDGLERIRGRLNAWVQRTGPGVRGELYRDAGGYMVNDVIPMRFRQHGPGWAPSRSTSPLIDEGIMRNANDWRVEGEKLLIGNTRPQARIQNRGGDIVPKTARFLAIPQSPPLSITQARMNKPRDFPGAFVLMKGPAGPGLYRKTGAFRGKVHGVEKIFAFVKKVTIKQRKFLYWGPALAEIRARWKSRLMGKSVAA